METKRLGYIDAARSIAILCVVLCHASEIFYFWSGEDFFSYSILLQIISFGVFSLGRLGVPLFLFISGYLLLGRDYDDTSCFLFWKKNLLSLLITTEIWIILYDLFLSWFDNASFSILGMLASMLFVNSVGFPHFWYLPMILGIYISLPFISKALKSFNPGTILTALAVFSFYIFAVPTANTILPVYVSNIALAPQLSLDFSGGAYGLFFIAGYMFRKYGNLDRRLSIFGFMVSFALTIGMQIFLLRNGIVYLVWYDSLPLAMTAFFLFSLIIGRQTSKPSGNILLSLSRCAFGIYLVHPPLNSILRRYIPFGEMPLNPRVFVLFALLLFISWGLVELISKIPALGKLLFLYKRK